MYLNIRAEEMWLYLLGVVLYLHIKKYSMKFTFTWPVDMLWLGDCELLHWTFSASLQRRFMADNLLPCSRVRPQQHRPQTSAASSKHCTPKHSSFQPGQQLCLLPPQHQAWIFQLYRQLCASIRALQPHEPRHWQWPFTSGQSRVSRQTSCCIPEPNSQFPEAVI